MAGHPNLTGQSQWCWSVIFGCKFRIDEYDKKRQKNWTTAPTIDCRLTNCQQTDNSRLTNSRRSTDKQPTVSWQTANSFKRNVQLVKTNGHQWVNCQLYDGCLSVHYLSIAFRYVDWEGFRDRLFDATTVLSDVLRNYLFSVCHILDCYSYY